MQGDDAYFLPPNIIARLQNSLQQRADATTQQWKQNYFKLQTPNRGVRMQEIRFVVHRWHTAWEAEMQIIPTDLERLVAIQLFEQEYLEEKLAATIIINEILIPKQQIKPLHLHLFEPLFQANHISNRSIGDNFANKVLLPLLVDGPLPVSTRLRDVWLVSENVWQARSALMALKELARDALHQDLLLFGCQQLLKIDQSTSKSAVGAALRELGKHRPGPVLDFLNVDHNLELFDSQALAKATENLPEKQRRRLKARRKVLQMPPTLGTQPPPPPPPTNEAGGSSSTQLHPGLAPAAATDPAASALCKPAALAIVPVPQPLRISREPRGSSVYQARRHDSDTSKAAVDTTTWDCSRSGVRTRSGAGGGLSRAQGVAASAGMLLQTGVAAAAAVGGVRDPLGVGPGFLEGGMDAGGGGYAVFGVDMGEEMEGFSQLADRAQSAEEQLVEGEGIRGAQGAELPDGREGEGERSGG